MEVRKMANGLVSRQASRLVCQRLTSHLSHSRRSSPISQVYNQSIRSLSATSALPITPPTTPSRPQPPSRSQPAQDEKFNTDTISDLLDDIYDSVGSEKGSHFSKGRKSQDIGTEFKSLFKPNDVGSVTRAVRDSVIHGSNEPGRMLRRYPELKLNARLGRSVAVEPTKGVDVQQAFTVVESLCRFNKIHKDARDQKYHVRRGIVRKQVKIGRWRRQFKEGFHQLVSRCVELRRQGW